MDLLHDSHAFIGDFHLLVLQGQGTFVKGEAFRDVLGGAVIIGDTKHKALGIEHIAFDVLILLSLHQQSQLGGSGCMSHRQTGGDEQHSDQRQCQQTGNVQDLAGLHHGIFLLLFCTFTAGSFAAHSAQAL